MTDDKRKKLESCFDSLQRITSLYGALTMIRDQVSDYLQEDIERLEENQQVDETEAGDMELKEGLIRLDDTDVKYIKGKYTESLWETMNTLLPHYKTDKQ